MSDEILTERRGRVLVITIKSAGVAERGEPGGEPGPGRCRRRTRRERGPVRRGDHRRGRQLLRRHGPEAFAAGEIVSIPGRGIGFTEKPPRKPLISAVEGYALAGGTEIVLATDLVVASRTAKFGIPEVKRGLVAAGGGLLRLPRRIPYQKALELALTGDSFTAEQGEAWGFVNVVTEPGEALAGAIAFAEKRTPNWTGT